jgi:hypothetical protein
MALTWYSASPVLPGGSASSICACSGVMLPLGVMYVTLPGRPRWVPLSILAAVDGLT